MINSPGWINKWDYLFKSFAKHTAIVGELKRKRTISLQKDVNIFENSPLVHRPVSGTPKTSGLQISSKFEPGSLVKRPGLERSESLALIHKLRLKRLCCRV